jgi:integrase
VWEPSANRPTSVTGAWRPFAKRAGYERVTFRTFRKTVATLLDEAGLTARQIADTLGHARPSMTQDVYMGRRVASRAAAQTLDQVLGEAAP